MIAAGGTGGHVYPALAAAESVVKLDSGARLDFVGTVGGFERQLLDHAEVRLESRSEVWAGPLHGVNPLRALSSVLKLALGTIQAFWLLLRKRPQVIFSTGGWVSLPVALAAWVQRRPLLIYLPDIEPGLTIKVLRYFANKVAVTVPESKQYFKPGQAIVTGYPLRGSVKSATREDAVTHFGLDPNKQTLLVMGGSLGSRAINRAVVDILPEILESGVQVIHLTGNLDWERVQEQAGELMGHPHYHAYAYLHGDIALAYAAADLAICRAGASLLGEFPFFRLPSVLIPLAYSWRYQQVNTEYLAGRGAAIHLDETKIETDLLPTIRDLLGDPARLAAMRDNLAALAGQDGADEIAYLLREMAGQA